jgi:hypothetical protein
MNSARRPISVALLGGSPGRQCQNVPGLLLKLLALEETMRRLLISSAIGLGVLLSALAPTVVPTPASAWYYHHRYYHHRYYGYRPYYHHRYYHHRYYHRPYYHHRYYRHRYYY